MKYPWRREGESQAQPCIRNYTANSLESVSLVTSGYFLKTSCPCLTNLSLQLTWFLSFPIGKLPNPQKKMCKSRPVSIEWRQPLETSQMWTGFFLPAGYFHGRMCFKGISMARDAAKIGLQSILQDAQFGVRVNMEMTVHTLDSCRKVNTQRLFPSFRRSLGWWL